MAKTPRPRRRAPEPKLIDRILDYPYHRLFGLKGQLVIASAVLVGLAVKFVAGISTVAVDPWTCRLAWYDEVYRPFFRDRIIANSKRQLGDLYVENQTTLRVIKDGRNPYHSSADGNVYRARRINPDKFFWRAQTQNMTKQNEAIAKCQAQLRNNQF